MGMSRGRVYQRAGVGISGDGYTRGRGYTKGQGMGIPDNGGGYTKRQWVVY